MRAAIIADDLTGACDSAARAALAGWRPRVLLKGAQAGLDISVISTSTRNLAEESAAEAVTQAARALMARGVRPLFKKIDSVLRGPWAAEVAALSRVTAAEVVAVCPAFPACGRTVRGGVVYRHGETLGALAPALEAAGLGGAGPALVLGDAETEQDLASFVDSVAARGRGVLWVGSAGLARYAFGQRDWVPAPSPRVTRWLIVAGSSHPATLAQLEEARSAGLEVVEANLAAATVQPGLESGTALGLFFIGGYTAERAVRHLCAGALDVQGEALPGIALGRIVGGLADGLPFLSKSGGFGTAGAVVQAIQVLRP